MELTVERPCANAPRAPFPNVRSENIPMKSIYKYAIAGLLASAAIVQAQISSVSVNSDSFQGGWETQVIGLLSRSPALVNIQTPSPNPYYDHFTQYLGTYYTATANTGSTVVAYPSGYYGRFTTSITNSYSPNLGYSDSAPFYNVSGRFRIEAPYTYEDEYGFHEEGGSEATLTFYVETAGNFSIDLLGPALSNYGFSNPCERPIVELDNTWSAGVDPATGAGSTGTVFLSQGSHTVRVRAEANTLSGVAHVSVNAR